MDNDRLRALRAALEASGWSTGALAREAGISPTALARVLSGKRLADPALLRAVAQALTRWGRRYAQAAERLEAARRDERP